MKSVDRVGPQERVDAGVDDECDAAVVDLAGTKLGELRNLGADEGDADSQRFGTVFAVLTVAAALIAMIGRLLPGRPDPAAG